MRRIITISGLALLLLCAGCLTGGEYKPTHYYTLAPRPQAPSEAQPIPVSAAVRRFTAVLRYDQRMVRRKSAVEMTYDEYHRWSEMPEEMVGNTFCKGLLARRTFGSMTGPDIDVASDVVLEGRLVTFEQDTEQHAVCTLGLVLRRGNDFRVLWSETVSARAPVQGGSAAALARAMSNALDQIVSQCDAEWRRLEGLRRLRQGDSQKP